MVVVLIAQELSSRLEAHFNITVAKFISSILSFDLLILLFSILIRNQPVSNDGQRLSMIHNLIVIPLSTLQFLSRHSKLNSFDFVISFEHGFAAAAPDADDDDQYNEQNKRHPKHIIPIWFCFILDCSPSATAYIDIFLVGFRLLDGSGRWRARRTARWAGSARGSLSIWSRLAICSRLSLRSWSWCLTLLCSRRRAGGGAWRRLAIWLGSWSGLLRLLIAISNHWRIWVNISFLELRNADVSLLYRLEAVCALEAYLGVVAIYLGGVGKDVERMAVADIDKSRIILPPAVGRSQLALCDRAVLIIIIGKEGGPSLADQRFVILIVVSDVEAPSRVFSGL